MAGNAGLLKHAPNASGCALAIEDAIRRAGAREGLFQSLQIGEAAVPELIARWSPTRVASVRVYVLVRNPHGTDHPGQNRAHPGLNHGAKPKCSDRSAK